MLFKIHTEHFTLKELARIQDLTKGSEGSWALAYQIGITLLLLHVQNEQNKPKH